MVKMRFAVMRFSVRVPVLSVQITFAQPRVSTLCRRRISARRRRMRLTASASEMVTIAGRPSGTAATASEMPVISMLNGSSPRKMPAMDTTAHTARQPTAMYLPSSASLRWSGVGSSSISCSMPAIRPISVPMPVAVTIALPRPRVTIAPI